MCNFQKLSKSLKMQKVHTKCKLVNLIKKSKGGVLILFHALIFRTIHKSHVPKQLFIFHSFAKFLLKFCSFFFKLVILNVYNFISQICDFPVLFTFLFVMLLYLVYHGARQRMELRALLVSIILAISTLWSWLKTFFAHHLLPEL